MTPVLIFDFDGTLLDSRDKFFEVSKAFYLRERGVDMTLSQFLGLFKGNVWENFRALGFSDEDRTAFVSEFFPVAMEKSHLLEGIDDVLRALKKDRGFEMHILTSNDEALATQKLNDYLLLDYFETITGNAHGPKADILRKNFPDPSCCWHIGDTTGDIVAGKDAGMGTVGVTWGFHDEDTLAESRPDHLIHTPSQLLDIFTA